MTIAYVYQPLAKPSYASDEAKVAFKRHLRGLGRSLDTSITYSDHLAPFANWCGARGIVPEDAAAEDVEAFLTDQLVLVSSSTCHVRLSALKAWFSWLVVTGHREDHPARKLTVKKEKRQPRPPLKDDSFDKMLRLCRNGEESLLLRTAAACGLRISEVVGIQRRDLFEETGLVLIHGKGGKERWVAPGPSITAELIAHCEGRSVGRVFPMRREQARRIMQRIATDAGVQGFYPHRLRISFAHRFLSAT